MRIWSLSIKRSFKQLNEKKDDDWKKTGCIMMRIMFVHEANRVTIPNILVNGIFSHQGIGKKMISLVFNVCKLFGYRLFLVDMVESFYKRMLNRGAAVIVDYDIVEITDNTTLD
ncbi:MAG: hypothetical protein FWD60_00485 [Candidatus Azobacteroides sp.]|nr:hypothetical protein [Candidatus Azobacteroides sp.]